MLKVCTQVGSLEAVLRLGPNIRLECDASSIERSPCFDRPECVHLVDTEPEKDLSTYQRALDEAETFLCCEIILLCHRVCGSIGDAVCVAWGAIGRLSICYGVARPERC